MTEPDFSGKFSFGPNQAKSAQNDPKWMFTFFSPKIYTSNQGKRQNNDPPLVYNREDF